MTPTLLDKLKALNPTEGEWDNTQYGSVYSGQMHIADVSNGDDCELITLAPSMRQELLKMEEERTYVRGMLRQLSALNEDHEYFKCIAGLIQQSREYLRNTNPTQP